MENVFVKGLYAKKHEKSPDFVICNLSYKVDEFIQFLKENEKNGCVNTQVLKSKEEGTLYSVLDNFEPKANTAHTQVKNHVKTKETDPFQNGNSEDDMPF